MIAFIGWAACALMWWLAFHTAHKLDAAETNLAASEMRIAELEMRLYGAKQ